MWSMPGTLFGNAVHIVLGEPHLHPRLIAACLFAGAARKSADDVGAPLRKDGLDGVAEPAP